MKKILTLIIDGLGIRESEEGNAFKKANMPNYNNLLERFPHATLDASGESVGLPKDQASTEIIGYETLAAGTILKQKSSFVHEFVDKDNLATNTILKSTLEHVRKNKSTLHIIGLMSDAGISSNIQDTVALIKYLKEQEIDIAVDFIADGKDVEPKTALKYVEMIEEAGANITTICGRYYAMNDDGKWDRTKIYYDLIRNGVGLKVKEIDLALKNCYIRNITDEFLPPIIAEQDKNIKDNDAILWMNHGEEGAKQILTALTVPNEVKDFEVTPIINLKSIIMYPVDPSIDATVLINEEEDTTSSLGIYLSKLELTQARIAEESNYDCVTYYFNNENEKKLPKCNCYLVEPPKVDDGILIEAGATAVTKQIMKCMERDTDFILASLNSANAVGHTGNFEKTVKILEFLDTCLGKIMESAALNFYTVFILSTQGNIEDMIDENGKPLMTNTTNRVPFIITDPKLKLINGDLTGVAPTILSYMDISIPESMKGSKILIKD